jgi:hypothetical protein
MAVIDLAQITPPSGSADAQIVQAGAAVDTTITDLQQFSQQTLADLSCKCKEMNSTVQQAFTCVLDGLRKQFDPTLQMSVALAQEIRDAIAAQCTHVFTETCVGLNCSGIPMPNSPALDTPTTTTTASTIVPPSFSLPTTTTVSVPTATVPGTTITPAQSCDIANWPKGTPGWTTGTVPIPSSTMRNVYVEGKAYPVPSNWLTMMGLPLQGLALDAHCPGHYPHDALQIGSQVFINNGTNAAVWQAICSLLQSHGVPSPCPCPDVCPGTTTTTPPVTGAPPPAPVIPPAPTPVSTVPPSPVPVPAPIPLVSPLPPAPGTPTAPGVAVPAPAAPIPVECPQCQCNFTVQGCPSVPATDPAAGAYPWSDPVGIEQPEAFRWQQRMQPWFRDAVDWMDESKRIVINSASYNDAIKQLQAALPAEPL